MYHICTWLYSEFVSSATIGEWEDRSFFYVPKFNHISEHVLTPYGIFKIVDDFSRSFATRQETHNFRFYLCIYFLFYFIYLFFKKLQLTRRMPKRVGSDD